MAGTEQKKKLQIGVYIEALCRFSQQFITDQFRPAYPAIKNDVDIKFFTFGKSKSFTNERGEIEFECQHGPLECERNRVQSCGLHELTGDPGRQADFIICTMGFGQDFAQCADLVGLEQQDMDECVIGSLGTELQLAMENASAPVIAQSGHVPTITFDGVYNMDDCYAALDDFEEVVWRKLSENW